MPDETYDFRPSGPARRRVMGGGLALMAAPALVRPADGGATWETNCIMDFQREAEA